MLPEKTQKTFLFRSRTRLGHKLPPLMLFGLLHNQFPNEAKGKKPKSYKNAKGLSLLADDTTTWKA